VEAFSRAVDRMNPYCQIEYVRSDSDIGTPCSNRAVAECADSALRFVRIAVLGVAENRSVSGVVTITSLIPV
jgi:hypothetical protein